MSQRFGAFRCFSSQQCSVSNEISTFRETIRTSSVSAMEKFLWCFPLREGLLVFLILATLGYFASFASNCVTLSNTDDLTMEIFLHYNKYELGTNTIKSGMAN